MSVPVYVVDAFTDERFSGNPAGVCILPQPAETSWMKDVAAELNHAETAFVCPSTDGYRLRWFTPTVEVDLCGHATLASAHVLWEQGILEPHRPARFFTRSGLLTATRRRGEIELDFPAVATKKVVVPSVLRRSMGTSFTYAGRNRFDYLLEVESQSALEALRPDMQLLATVPVRGIIVTSRSKSTEFDFVCRFFAPRAGIPEDPVTGSAFCALGPYWGGHLGKSELIGYQASSRGGVVKVRLLGRRVGISGRAVTVLKGELVD